nr:hypothetical protein CFP56_77969 [Quercus suber]
MQRQIAVQDLAFHEDMEARASNIRPARTSPTLTSLLHGLPFLRPRGLSYVQMYVSTYGLCLFGVDPEVMVRFECRLSTWRSLCRHVLRWCTLLSGLSVASSLFAPINKPFDNRYCQATAWPHQLPARTSTCYCRKSNLHRLEPSHPNAPKYITRYQDRLIRDSFMFLNLPFELRLMIYEYCVDVSGVEKILARYYHTFKDAENAASVKAPLVWVCTTKAGIPQKVTDPSVIQLRTPHIFVLNRQIYAEASCLLPKRALTFDHGLLDLAFLNDFVRAPVLRTLSSITVTDTGHDLFHGTKNPANSWYGYMELIDQLGKVFTPAGHRLKTFNLHFTSPEFKQHVTVCWDASFVCGYRDTLKKALAILGRVRDIGCVSLQGFPEPMATNLKKAMERPYLTFFSLPGDVRNKIYRRAANLSDVSVVMNRTMAASHFRGCYAFPVLSTPTVLLLNRQITSEALQVVRRLVIMPCTTTMARIKDAPSIIHFVTIPTLQRVQELHISIRSWHCIDILNSLLPVLVRHHSLKKMYFFFKDSHNIDFLASNFRYPDMFLHKHLLPLTEIRGLESVEFARSGSLPICYTHPLRQIMLSNPVAGEVLPTLMVRRIERCDIPFRQ